MTKPLTPEREELFIGYFGAPRFEEQNDCRLIVHALLEELKRVSALLGLRVDVERLEDGRPNEYPRIHGVIPVAQSPILWSLCGPKNDPNRRPENHKLELLPHQDLRARDRAAHREVMRIAREAGFTLASKSPDAIPKVGITRGIKLGMMVKYGAAIVEVERIVRPVYS